jgi:protein MpaA
MSKIPYITLPLGYSVHGKEISAYTNNANADNYTYLIAGFHGDEPEGVFILGKLFSWLQLQNLSQPIIIIPVLNPDGLALNTRVNGNTIDLNRNWPSSNWSSEYQEQRYNPGVKPLSEPETIFLFNLFAKFKPAFIFSFHTWQPLLDHNLLAKQAANYLAKYNNYKVVDYIGYPTPGSLGSYVDEFLNCGIITYELPPKSPELSMDDIWRENVTALQNYFLDYSSV